MPSVRDVDVVIVGGGIAGSSLAVSLVRAGLGVTVAVERERRFQDRVRGESIHPWGVGVARELGLLDVLAASGAHPLPLWRQYEDRELRTSFDWREHGPEGLCESGHLSPPHAGGTARSCRVGGCRSGEACPGDSGQRRGSAGGRRCRRRRPRHAPPGATPSRRRWPPVRRPPPAGRPARARPRPPRHRRQLAGRGGPGCRCHPRGDAPRSDGSWSSLKGAAERAPTSPARPRRARGSTAKPLRAPSSAARVRRSPTGCSATRRRRAPRPSFRMRTSGPRASPEGVRGARRRRGGGQRSQHRARPLHLVSRRPRAPRPPDRWDSVGTGAPRVRSAAKALLRGVSSLRALAHHAGGRSGPRGGSAT